MQEPDTSGSMSGPAPHAVAERAAENPPVAALPSRCEELNRTPVSNSWRRMSVTRICRRRLSKRRGTPQRRAGLSEFRLFGALSHIVIRPALVPDELVERTIQFVRSHIPPMGSF